MNVTLYGIPNCDTVKKARTWLDDHGIDYAFHDYKKAGIDAGRLCNWCQVLGWQKVLNRAGTTFRKLPEAEREGMDGGKAIALMQTNPSSIKRPIVEHPGGLLLAFKPDEWAAVFGSA